MIKINNKRGFSLVEAIVSTTIFSFVMVICADLLMNANKSQKMVIQSTQEREVSNSIKDRIKSELSSISYIFSPNYPLPVDFVDDRYIGSNDRENNYEKDINNLNSDLINKSGINAGCKLDTIGTQTKFNSYSGDALYFAGERAIDVNDILNNDSNIIKTTYPIPQNSKIYLQNINYVYLSKANNSDKNLRMKIFKDKYFYKGRKEIIPMNLMVGAISDLSAILPDVSFEASNSYSYKPEEKVVYKRNIMYRLFLKGYKITIEDVNKPEQMMGIFPASGILDTDSNTITLPTLRTNPYSTRISYNLNNIIFQQYNTIKPVLDLVINTLPVNTIAIPPLPVMPSYNKTQTTVITSLISKEPIVDYHLARGSMGEDEFKIKRVKSRFGLLFNINKIDDQNPVILDPTNFKQVDSFISNVSVDINLFDKENSLTSKNFNTSFAVETLNNRKSAYEIN